MDCIFPVQERGSLMVTKLDFSHCDVKTRISSICSCQSWRPQKCRLCLMQRCANVRTYTVHAETLCAFLKASLTPMMCQAIMKMVMWRSLVCRSPLRASQGSSAYTCRATESLADNLILSTAVVQNMAWMQRHVRPTTAAQDKGGHLWIPWRS